MARIARKERRNGGHHPARYTGERTPMHKARRHALLAADGEAGRRAREVPPHAVKINGTIAIYLVSHDNKR